MIYLVFGVQNFGRNWVKILANYKNYFIKAHHASDLCNKYNLLVRKQEIHDDINKKLEIMIQNKKIDHQNTDVKV